MKKVLFIIPLFFLVACGGGTQASSSQSISSESVSISEVKGEELVSEVSCFTYREELVIKQNGTTCYSYFSRGEYDDVSGNSTVYKTLSQVSDLDTNTQKDNEMSRVYYDGEYSYTYDSDGFYIREESSYKPNKYTYSYDFSVISEKNVEVKNGSTIYSAKINDNEVGKMLKNSVNSSTNATAEIVISSGAIYKMEVAYVSGNFDVKYNIEFGYLSANIQIPNQVK